MTPTLNLGILASALVVSTNAGNLYSWGRNDSGRLGDGTTTQRNSPVQVGSNADWTNVEGGWDSSGGIRDRKAFTWGNGTTSPTQVGSDIDWDQISAGGVVAEVGIFPPFTTVTQRYYLGIRSGKLYAWGTNQSGNLGDGTTTTRANPVQIGSDTDWQQISAWASVGFSDAVGHSMGIRGGKLYRWGNGTTSPTQVGSDTDWTNLAQVNSEGGSINGFAIRAGRIYSIDASRTVSQIGSDTDWSTVEAGQFHRIAIKTNGKLYAWGANEFGQLGDGTTTDRANPTQIGSDTDWEKISASARHSLGIRGGKLYAWGDNFYGNLGDGTTSQRTSPTQIGSATNWKSVGTGELFSFGIR